MSINSPKIRKKYLFSLIGGEIPRTKIWKVGPLKNMNFNLSSFKRCPYDNDQSAWGFEYNFRCLKRFFRKVRRKLRSAFFLKLRFFKIRLLVTWLKYLLWAYFTYLARFSYVPYLRALNISKMDLQSVKISNFQRTIKGTKNRAVFRRSKKQLWKFLR